VSISDQIGEWSTRDPVAAFNRGTRYIYPHRAFTRTSKRDIRICAEREQLLAVVHAVPEAPQSTASRGHEQKPSALVVQLEMLFLESSRSAPWCR
jgi:hypothetical protein